jgi:hypothetical protein
MEKTDFRKMLRELYAPPAKEFALVEVPEMQFLMIDGSGNPNTSSAYGQALEALYSVSYKLKFMSKKDPGKDYVVPPQEALWWAEDMAAFVEGDRDSWQWTAMIMQPDWITAEMVERARTEAARKADLPALPALRFESFAEGLSVQILHVGPYSEEAPTIRAMHEDFLPENGLTENGRHHEIYLNDPRRTPPEKLKTVLRQPVRKRG